MHEDVVRRGRCRNSNTFREFYFTMPALNFCEYRRVWKPTQHIVSPPKSTAHYNNHRDTHTYSALLKLWQCCWSNAPRPTPLAFIELASGSGVLKGGEGHIVRTLCSRLVGRWGNWDMVVSHKYNGGGGNWQHLAEVVGFMVRRELEMGRKEGSGW